MNKRHLIKKYKIPAAGGLVIGLFWLNSLTEDQSGQQIPKQAIVEQELAEAGDGKPLPEKESMVSAEIAIDVKGAVTMPGIYVMTDGGRVNDVINKAGGLTENANVEAINLAQKLQDEMVVYVPEIGEEISIGLTASSSPNLAGGTAGNSEQKTQININEADTAGLQELPGIGESKAQTIIDHRETEGLFKTVEELKNVSGIGDKTFEKLEPFITVQ